MSIVAAVTDAATQPAGAHLPFHFDYTQWRPSESEFIKAGVTTAVILLAGLLITALIGKWVGKNKLIRALRYGWVAIALYAGLLALKFDRMSDSFDTAAWWTHRLFVAVMLLVGLRVLDALLIIPVMTRGGKLPLPRFVHQVVLLVLGLFVALGWLSLAVGLDVSSFLAGSAVLSIVLGLALQETLGNFFSGMVMQASSPFAIGDWIECAGTEGRVVDMTWRAVTVQTPEDNFVLIPNGIAAKEKIINHFSPTRATARNVFVGLEYKVPPNQAREVLRQAALETQGVLHTPAPVIYVHDFAESSVVYRVKFWIDQPQQHPILEQNVRTNIWYRLKQAGMEIPFPMRTVEMVNLDEKIHRDTAAARAERSQILSNIPLFASLSVEQRQQLAEEARVVMLAPAQVLFRQDAEGSSFYVIQRGQLEVLVHQDGKEVKVAVLEAGMFFGEMSALTGQPRTATIRAATESSCLEITRDHLHALFEADPGAMEQVSAIIAQRNVDREAKIRQQTAAQTADAAEQQRSTLVNRMRKFFGIFS